MKVWICLFLFLAGSVLMLTAQSPTHVVIDTVYSQGSTNATMPTPQNPTHVVVDTVYSQGSTTATKPTAQSPAHVVVDTVYSQGATPTTMPTAQNPTHVIVDTVYSQGSTAATTPTTHSTAPVSADTFYSQGSSPLSPPAEVQQNETANPENPPVAPPTILSHTTTETGVIQDWHNPDGFTGYHDKKHLVMKKHKPKSKAKGKRYHPRRHQRSFHF